MKANSGMNMQVSLKHHHFICEHCGKIKDIEDCNVSVFVKKI